MVPKTYPNLNPSAAIPVDRDQVLHLDPFFDRFRTHRDGHHGYLVPNLKYVFVRTTGGETLMHPTYRHPALAEGRPVAYAGEAAFNNGQLIWWSNGSGNYRPDAEHAKQAGLPMDRFFSFSEVIRGEHQRPRRDDHSRLVQGRLAGAPIPHWPPAWRPMAHR